MNVHKNARLTPRGRALMVSRILDQDWSVTAAAEAAGVSERTAHNGLLARRPFNVAAVALANKTARIAWVIMTQGGAYRAAT